MNTTNSPSVSATTSTPASVDTPPNTRPNTSPRTRPDNSPDTSPTFNQLRRILLRDYPLDPGVITPDAVLDSLGIDSLGVAELLFTIEDEFKISVPAEPVQLASVGDVASFIDGLIAAQQAPATPAGAAALHAVSGR